MSMMREKRGSLEFRYVIRFRTRGFHIKKDIKDLNALRSSQQSKWVIIRNKQGESFNAH